MEENILISVIVPVYNAARYLPRCIEAYYIKHTRTLSCYWWMMVLLTNLGQFVTSTP